MKVKARIEQALFKAIDEKGKLKNTLSLSNILKNDERIKVLEWVLSDKIDELYFIGE